MTASATPPDYTWPGFEALPEPLRVYHRRFFEVLAQRNPLTLREYRRAFRALYEFMQREGLEELSVLTPQHLEAFQHWCYRHYHWAPGNVRALMERTLRRIGSFLKEFGLLKENPFARVMLVTPQQQQVAQSLSWFRAVRLHLRWLKARGVTDEVRRGYLPAIRHFYLYLRTKEKIRPPAEVDPEQIGRFRIFLATHPVKSRRHALTHLSPATQRVTLRRVRWFFRYLDREGLIPSEPAGWDAEQAGVTDWLREVVTEFLAYVQMRYATDSKEPYVRSLDRFLQWVETLPGVDQKPQMTNDRLVRVLTDYQHWLTQFKHPDGSPMSVPERESRLYPLRSLLFFCYRKGFLARDLRRFVIVPKRKYELPHRLLTVEEMARLLEAPSDSEAGGIRDRAMMEVAYSGLRVNELTNLKVGHVDLKENRIFIEEGKGDKDRVVPMTSAALYWLNRWLRRRTEFLAGRKDAQVVFLSSRGRPLRRQEFNRALAKYVKQAGLSTVVSSHDLRRITATHLAVNGAPLRQIQALLGHASLKVTTKYVRLTNDQVKAEYAKTHPSTKRQRHLVPVA